jgi:hypothetical protein
MHLSQSILLLGELGCCAGCTDVTSVATALASKCELVHVVAHIRLHILVVLCYHCYQNHVLKLGMYGILLVATPTTGLLVGRSIPEIVYSTMVYTCTKLHAYVKSA